MFAELKITSIFAPRLRNNANTVALAQLVRASDCGSEGRGFEPHIPPQKQLMNPVSTKTYRIFYYYDIYLYFYSLIKIRLFYGK